MTKAERRKGLPTPSLSGLLTATVLVLGATAWWAFYLDGDSSYQALASGAWTTTVAFWTLFLVRLLQRRQDS